MIFPGSVNFKRQKAAILILAAKVRADMKTREVKKTIGPKGLKQKFCGVQVKEIMNYEL